MIGNRVAKQKSKKERTHGRHSSTDRFSAGQEQAECGKAASRQGKCIRIGGKARLFHQSACEQGFRPRSLRHGGLRRPLRSTRLGTDPVEHREAILRKKDRLNAKSRVLVRLSAREDFHSSGTRLRAQPKPFLRRSSRGLHFAPQSCMALPPPAFPRSVSILSCPSVLCLRTSNLSGLECFLLRSEQLVQHTFRCLQKAFGQKVRLCLPVGRFFDAPFAQNKNFGVRIRQKQRGMGGDEKLGIFADQSVQSSQKRKLTRGRKSGLRFVQQVQAAA